MMSRTPLQRDMDEWAREAEEQYAKSPRDRAVFGEDEFVQLYIRTKLLEYSLLIQEREDDIKR